MKIECCACGAKLGEKCPFCGSKNVRVLSHPSKLFFCRDCDTLFEKGQGGKTSTYCEPCKARALEGVAKPAQKVSAP